ncbi:TonB-dependent receptor, partial [Terriglobus sp. YAF25]
SYTYIPQNYRNPYVESYNLFVQHALPWDFSLSVGYVGNHGVGMGANQNINLSSRLGGGNADLPLNIAFGRTAAVTQYFIGTSTNYNSLQVSLNRRFTHGFSNITSFTYGKGLNLFTGDDGGFMFYQDQRRNYGPTDYDRKFNLQEAFTYELPFGRGKKFLNHGIGAYAIGGWKLSGVVSVVTGTPFSVTANNNLNTPGWTQTANLTGTFTKLGGGPGHKWFDTSVFSQPAGCTAVCSEISGTSVGNTARNAFRGPGFVQNNASIFKTFPVYKEGTTLDIRMDIFQVSNTPQFATPTTSTGPDVANITGGTFGQITRTIGSGSGVNGTGGGRSLQLAAILKF